MARLPHCRLLKSPEKMDCSIIISTCNRPQSLAATLESFREMEVPSDWSVELIVVDNAPSEATAAVTENARLQRMESVYLREPKRGKSNALNTALGVARGEALLFTDDDVRPAKNWIEATAKPLLSRECDVVVGLVKLPPELSRPWITSMHKMWLATEPYLRDGPEFVGANSAFHRSVLERVPAFDPELGPGASGFGDDHLLSVQMNEAGFRMKFVPQSVVTHYFDPSRLLRSHWLDTARKRACSTAYLLHHWEHGEMKMPQARYLYVASKLFLRRLL